MKRNAPPAKSNLAVVPVPSDSLTDSKNETTSVCLELCGKPDVALWSDCKRLETLVGVDRRKEKSHGHINI